jgi:SAM-dependent methyltransferase
MRPGAETLHSPARGTIEETLATAERAARYRLIAPLARGKRVLDAPCTMAEGCVLLAAAGAAGVAGLDSEQAVIEAVRAGIPSEIELARAEPSELPHADASFDMVTSMGAGGNGPGQWLDELCRVLAPDGLLVTYADPTHLAALESELRSRLANVRLVRERAWVALALLADESTAGAAAPEEPRFSTDPAATATPAAGAVALASAGPLPALPQLVALTEPFESERLSAEVVRQREELRERDDRIAELQAAAAERLELRRLLTEAEQLLAELPELRRQSRELDKLSSSAEWRIATALRVPHERVEGMWLPTVRRRAKQLLGRLIRIFRAS